METKFQTSFIPKQPVTAEAPRRSSMTGLFFLFGFIIFMASIAAAGGVFIYGQIVSKNIEQGTAQLTLNKNAFDPNTISQLTRLNDRINAADYLLKRHRSVSTLFSVLGNATLKNVRFTDFNYSGIDDKISLTMKGQAASYETVALQAKEFTNPNLKNVFRSPLFGDLTLDAQGNVSFSFATNVDPFLVDYYKLKKEEYNAGGNSAAPTGAQSGSSNAAGQGFTQTSGSVNGASVTNTDAASQAIMQVDNTSTSNTTR